MPLHKRKPFPLVETPEGLDPDEHVFQVRFTKEIFRGYQDYLNRLNLYRERVWTCKVSGKTNLTYEEALVAEYRATEKVQQIPEELIYPILQIVQFSALNLTDLVEAVRADLQGCLFVGAELQGKKNELICDCKILKAISGSDHTLYEVGWLDKHKKVTNTSTLDESFLMQKRPPVSRSMLRSFIRDSTSQSSPWIVHEKLAKKHGLPIEPPKQVENGNNRKRKNPEQVNGKIKKSKEGDEKVHKEPIKYPIDDLLVEPGVMDHALTDRPSPSRDFRVPMECVGDLLMVWNFCSSFSRLLKLWPFSLDDFEKAICRKDSNLVLIIEAHSAILRLLVKDKGEYYLAVQKKNRKSKIKLFNWNEYLCDFLEMDDKPEVACQLRTLKRGHYGLLDIHVKLGILCKLVSEALNTDAIRDQLNEDNAQLQALKAAIREEAQKNKEGNHLKKDECSTNCENNSKLSNGCGYGFRSSPTQAKNSPSNANMDLESSRNSNVHSGEKKLEVYSRRNKTPEYGTIIADKMEPPTITEEHNKLKQKRKDGGSDHKKTEMQKKESLERDIGKRMRTDSLGKDRDYNRYWFFRRDGRLFVESSDSNEWGYYTTKEEFDAFIGSLNQKGVREKALKGQLEKHYMKISSALQKRSKEAAHRNLLEDAVLRRSTRVRAQPRDGPETAFRRYVNKWKEE